MTRRRSGPTFVLLAVLTVVSSTLGGTAAPAEAAPAEKPAPERSAADRGATEKAREHFRSGEAFFKLEKYNEALSEYEQGYIAKSDASFLYNIAQCHRLMGNKQAALRFYRRFLSEATRIPNREMVEAHIRDLEKALAKAPPPASAPSPTEPPPTTSTTAPPAVAAVPAPSPPPGSATTSSPSVSASASTSGNPPSVDLSAPPPSPGSAPIIDDAPPPGSPPSRDQPPIYERWWFWTAIGAVAVAGGITALVLLNHKSPTCEPGRNCL